jgi:hypothetical protein
MLLIVKADGICSYREPGSSVSMSGYGLNDRAIEVRSPAEAKGFFLWGPPSLQYNGYRGSFSRG